MDYIEALIASRDSSPVGLVGGGGGVGGGGDGGGRGRSQVEKALMLAFDPDRKWREGIRLLPELLPSWLGGRKWDLFVALVRKN